MLVVVLTMCLTRFEVLNVWRKETEIVLFPINWVTVISALEKKRHSHRYTFPWFNGYANAARNSTPHMNSLNFFCLFISALRHVSRALLKLTPVFLASDKLETKAWRASLILMFAQLRLEIPQRFDSHLALILVLLPPVPGKETLNKIFYTNKKVKLRPSLILFRNLEAQINFLDHSISSSCYSCSTVQIYQYKHDGKCCYCGGSGSPRSLRSMPTFFSCRYSFVPAYEKSVCTSADGQIILFHEWRVVKLVKMITSTLKRKLCLFLTSTAPEN